MLKSFNQAYNRQITSNFTLNVSSYEMKSSPLAANDLIFRWSILKSILSISLNSLLKASTVKYWFKLS